jgi:hypothetical protein
MNESGPARACEHPMFALADDAAPTIHITFTSNLSFDSAAERISVAAETTLSSKVQINVSPPEPANSRRLVVLRI